METSEKYTPDKETRNALRAYLQRCEVRLSTMHRIAGLFLNGAGLLILLPIFLKDAFIKILSWSLKETFESSIAKITFTLGTAKMILGFSILIALSMSLLLPLLALSNLLKEIVWFYFVPHATSFKNNAEDNELFHPRFTISALAFAIDEPEGISVDENKLGLVSTEIQREIANSNLVVNLCRGTKDPHKMQIRKYLNRDFRIIPSTRIENEEGTINSNDIKFIYNAKFGLAGGNDLTLIQEAAQAEATLVRNSLSLRRLVLRYLKSLLMLTWTVFISFIAYTVVEDSSIIPEPLKSRSILFIYLLWFGLTPFVFKVPTYWIQLNRNPKSSIQGNYRDPDIAKYEGIVQGCCGFVCLVISTLLLDSNEALLGTLFILVGLILLFQILIQQIYQHWNLTVKQIDNVET